MGLPLLFLGKTKVNQLGGPVLYVGMRGKESERGRDESCETEK